MPLAIDPNETFRIVLESDKGKSPEPYFEYRFSPVHELRIAENFHKRVNKAKVDSDIGEDCYKELFSLLTKRLEGWGNMGQDYNPVELDKILNLNEAMELFFAMLQQTPSIEDKKKLESALPSTTGKSAKRVRGKRTVKSRSVSTIVKQSDA